MRANKKCWAYNNKCLLCKNKCLHGNLLCTTCKKREKKQSKKEKYKNKK